MIRIITILAISLISIFQGFSQNYIDYNRDTRWFIGLNGGGTWSTQTEIPYRFRAGAGFTFGKSFGMNQDKFFCWDLRARFLYAQFQGQSLNRYNLDSNSVAGLDNYNAGILQNYGDSLGYFLPNYRTTVLSGSLELVLNTNRLRQRTGVNLWAFGGIGIKGYHTAADLLNNDEFNDPIYNYDALPSGSSATDILDFQDGNYETDLVGNAFSYDVDWAPSFGFGISKQVHPAVAIGLEHKMTWTRANLFDGMPNNIDGTPSGLNDIYHYTALTFKFHLFNGSRTISNNNNGNNDNTDDHVNVDDFDTNENPPIIDQPAAKKKPVVDIYDPNTSPYTTTQNTFRIKANIYYVENKASVTFKQDGNINSNFIYNPTTDQFESTVVLHPGQNLFEITGVNESGSDYESVIIIYQKDMQQSNPPIVTITNPPYSPYPVNSSVFGLVSTVLNVDTKAQIRLYLNGVNLTSFNYDNGAKVVNASLNLIEGTNTVTVTATNDAGSDSKTIELVYRKTEALQPPIVDFVIPGVDPYYSSVNTINIKATALNVASKTGLTILLNGNPVSSYSFNEITKEIYFSAVLMEGANYVEITGVNKIGSDYESTTIIYNRPNAPRPPVVTFIDPSIDPITVYSSTYNVTAQVEHVASAANITLRINGVISTLFTYSTSSDLMNFTTSLVEGSNVIEITGTNEYGMDLEATTIIYKRTIPQAPPVVEITYPAVDNVEFGAPNMTLVASVLNVNSASDIVVKVNGVTTGAFSYNTYTKVLNLPLVLVEGSNIVEITGTNLVGSDSETRIIIYKKPVVASPPTVAFTNPPSSPYVVSDAVYTVTANTTHIYSKSQIVLKQNGVVIADGLYSFLDGHQIVFNTTLITGSNIFEVTVENPDGVADDFAIVNLELAEEPCLIPTVGYISPVPYSTVVNPNVTIDAQINNHTPGTIVELKLNGLSQGYMTYNAGTSIASKAITLAAGSNAITVIVTNDCGTNQATFTLNYDAPGAPCDPPALTATGATSFTTLESVISLTVNSTNVDASDDISVKLNGTVIPNSFDAGTGTITISGINLIVGANTISITVKTKCGPAFLTYTIVRDACASPVISGVTPATGTTITSSSIVLDAAVSNATSEEITVILNGVSQAFTYNALTDKLTQAFPLNVGLNTIIIQAENACGKTSKTITITREIPCQPIVTSLLSPAENVVTSVENKYTIVLHTAGINNVGQISVTLNGAGVIPSFDLISGNITLENLSLNDGVNSVIVSLTNDCSKGSVKYTITYNGCEPPVVVFNSIYAGMVVTDGIFNLAAVVTNITSPEAIVLKVNGVSVDFDFNPLSNLLTAVFPLVEGTNTVQIIANGCEKVTGTGTVIYNKPCDKITHTLLTPNTTPTVSVESEFAITLGTFGVESAAQITVKLNGTTIPFTFNVDSKIVTISGIDLIDGTNTVVVTMANDCSSDIVTYSIIYNGCKAPVITLGSNPPAVTTPVYTYKATVTNIATAAAIQLLVNGSPVPFTFNAVTGEVTASITLATNDNTIRLIANGCESASKDFVVSYTIPCKPITYTLGSPSTATISVADATYSINLVVANATGITVTKGGTSLPFTYADNLLTINSIALAEGLNTIIVNLTNGCSKETITYGITRNDCNTPTINLSTNPISVGAALYSFVATVTDISRADQIQLKLNGVSKPFSFDALSGTIAANLTLNVGGNTIQVIANGCESATESIAVTYTVPCAPVTYSLVSPTTLTTEVDAATTSISLSVANVIPGTIGVTLNGAPIAYSFTGSVISILTVPLISGTNIVAITFGNTCSSETATYTIIHEDCVRPEIIINGLTNGMEIVEKDLMFYASIYNVTDAGDIILKFNGASVPFVFNPVSKVLQAPLVLSKGDNSIEIIVNGCERASAGVTVVHNAPCAAPKYKLIVPTATDVTVDGDIYRISLSVENVTKEQITVKINGIVKPFTYAGGVVSIEAPYLSVPTNSIAVSLTNACGTATVNYKVLYNRAAATDPCVPVTYTLVTPNALKSSAVSTPYTIVFNTKNLKDGSNVTALVNGIGAMATYNAGKVTLSNITLKVGTNVVKFTLKNECSTETVTYIVTYTPAADGLKGDGTDGGSDGSGTKAQDAPVITPIMPVSAKLKVNSETLSFKASVTNIISKDNVQITVNGIPMTSHTYVPATKLLSANITLNVGVNVIKVSANNGQTAQYTYYVTYEKAPTQNSGGLDNGDKVGVTLTPEITRISPNSETAMVTEPSFILKARVTNISSKADLSLTMNNMSISNFTYNAATKEISCALQLVEGVNSIKLEARNADKKAMVSYVITYKKPLQKVDPGQNSGGTDNGAQVGAIKKPVIKNVNPIGTNDTVTKPTFLFKVNVLNVPNKEGITLNVNGTVITNFTFDPATGNVMATLTLTEGANSIRLTGKNGELAATKSYAILYQPAKPISDPVKSGEEKKEGAPASGGFKKGG